MGRNSSKTEDPATKRIMVVGASGVGKSSLVNLLIGDYKANVSDGGDACTFSCSDYFTNYKGVNYLISDTIGLCGANNSNMPHKKAVKELVVFTRNHRTGFNLFIFVMRKGRIMLSLEQTYALFYLAMFENKVPAILYVAECEQDEPMSRWRTENQKAFNSYIFQEIICGTTQRNNTQLEHIWKPKREETLENIWTAIEKHQLTQSYSMQMKLTSWQRVINIISKFFIDKEYFSTKSVINKNQLENYLKEMDVDQPSIPEIVDLIMND